MDGDGQSIFIGAPNRIDDGIPVFSEADRYTENYAKIALDHLHAVKPGQDNPFIENQLWQEMETATQSMIEKYVPVGAKILDVGVGLGRVLAPLTQYDRHGIDISMDYLKQARAKGIAAIYSRIEDMPYKDETFDAVVTTDVLEHVFDLAACTRQLLRVLKPGGLLILRVPFKEDLDVYLREDLDYEFVHMRTFDAASLRLHFSKIFGMEYLEHQEIAHYMQGSPRIKLRFLDRANPIYGVLRKVNWLAVWHPLWVLKCLTFIRQEHWLYWIYRLKDRHPKEFLQIRDDMVIGIEIGMVFRKVR